MKVEVEIGNKKYTVDFSKGIDISIPLNFNGEQPNTYGVEKATSKPYQDGNFVGDILRMQSAPQKVAKISKSIFWTSSLIARVNIAM